MPSRILSDEEQQSISRDLISAGAVLPCARCGDPNLPAVSDRLFSLPVAGDSPAELSMTTLSVVSTRCVHCGHLNLHNIEVP